MAHRSPLPSLLAAAMLLAACSPAATMTPAASPSATPPGATPTAQSTTAPTLAATPSGPAASTAGVLELKASKTVVLAAGTYTRSDFKPKITFQVSGGPWYCVQLVAGFFDIQADVDSPDVIAVQFARPQEVYTAGGLGIVAADAQTAATLVQSNPTLSVVESSESKIGGLNGYQVTVANTGSTDARVIKVQAGPLSIAPGRRLWMAFFDTSDGLLAIMVGGSTAKWDLALSAAEPILESITIGA